MADINTAEQLRLWFRGCPFLSSSNRFRVDYLGENPTEYSIESDAAPINWKQNVLGEWVKAQDQTARYIFAVRLPFGKDVQQNMENLGFCADVVDWIVQQSAARNLPQINEGAVKSINPTLTPYPVDMAEKSAIYHIKLDLPYKVTA